MNLEWVETFLRIAEEGSVSAAAQNLFLSQSTVSSRLAALEEELGYTLVSRERGKRYMDLTPEGVCFLPIARNMIDLKNRALSRDEISSNLRIAAVYSMNYSFLPFLYHRLLEHHRGIGCRIITTRSEEMYSLLEHRECDVCFSTVMFERKGIRTEELFRQKIVVIMRDEHPRGIRTIHPRDLDPKKEILHHSEPLLSQWHNYWWEENTQKLQVCSTHLLGKMLEMNPENAFWALVPMATVAEMPFSVQIYELTSPPPMRSCYLLERETNFPDRKLQVFREELSAFLKDENLMKKYDLEVCG